MTTLLPYAHGGPPLRCVLRATPEDFIVDEDLGFEPDGAGEHLLVRVEKRGANTEWVARALAKMAGVAPDAVSFAGMKDRHAVARQTFSIQLPARADPDASKWAHPEFRVLEAVRHSRKLRRGALKGNRFEITLRDTVGDHAAVAARLDAIAAAGVPNYFGEQRFGHGGANVERARRVFAGERVRRHELGVFLSAARAQIFNAVVATRIAAGTWDRALDGEVWMLAGSHSIFGPEPITPELLERQRQGDIVATGPLWGAGPLRSGAEVAAIEEGVAAQNAELAAGLVRFDLRQERRALTLHARDVAAEWIDPTSLRIRFWLNSGSYATAFLREICDWGEEGEQPAAAGSVGPADA
ncbi:MAG TPA: tRNA pseudouridine(13) synthase TruD [Rudaea sp.]